MALLAAISVTCTPVGGLAQKAPAKSADKPAPGKRAPATSAPTKGAPGNAAPSDIVSDNSVPDVGLNIPDNLQLYGKVDPNVRKPTAIVNAVSLSLFAGLTDDLTVNAVVDFLPRTRIISDRQGSALGDFIDVKLAYLEYTLPTDRIHLTLFAGKFDSVLGYEYRAQEAPDRRLWRLS